MKILGAIWAFIVAVLFCSGVGLILSEHPDAWTAWAFSALLFASLLLTIGVAWGAQGSIERLAVPGSKREPCSACGANAGVFCGSCGLLVPEHRSWDTKLSLLLMLHWKALVIFWTMTIIPGSLAIGRQWIERVRADEREKNEEIARKRQVADNVAATWSELRGPLIAFSAECGHLVAQGLRLPPACTNLFAQTVKAYVDVSWYLPTYIAELRVRCEASSKALERDRLPEEVGACTQLLAEFPSNEASKSFRWFVTAYEEYLEEPQHFSSAHKSSKSLELGRAAEALYVATRHLGCSLAFADLPGEPRLQERLSAYCHQHLKSAALPTNQESSIRTAVQALRPAPPCGAAADVIESEAYRLPVAEWFGVPCERE